MTVCTTSRHQKIREHTIEQVAKACPHAHARASTDPQTPTPWDTDMHRHTLKNPSVKSKASSLRNSRISCSCSWGEQRLLRVIICIYPLQRHTFMSSASRASRSRCATSWAALSASACRAARRWRNHVVMTTRLETTNMHADLYTGTCMHTCPYKHKNSYAHAHGRTASSRWRSNSSSCRSSARYLILEVLEVRCTAHTLAQV